MSAVPMRQVYFNHVADPAGVSRSIEIKRGLAGIGYVLELFERLKSDGQYVAVQYLYDVGCGGFFRLMGCEGAIVIEQPAIIKTQFETLYHSYLHYFVDFDPQSYASVESSEFGAFRKVWQELFDFFIGPLGLYLNDPRVNRNVFIGIEAIDGRQYTFDFSTIFDLQYRFYPIARNVRNYVVGVFGTSLSRFIENLLGLPKPTAAKTILLNGFSEFYSSEAISAAPRDIQDLALARKALYQAVFASAQAAGAKVIQMQNKEDLLGYFRMEWAGYFLQITAHFERSDDSNRLYFGSKSLRFDLFKKQLLQSVENGELRDDLVIDAITCTNFFNFRELYELGIKYLHLSLHNIDTDFTAYLLYELYTGINARTLGWDFPYFDGSSFVHEARSNALRCFFTLNQQQQNILIP